MKKIVKILAVLTAALVVIGFSGCSQNVDVGFDTPDVVYADEKSKDKDGEYYIKTVEFGGSNRWAERVTFYKVKDNKKSGEWVSYSGTYEGNPNEIGTLTMTCEWMKDDEYLDGTKITKKDLPFTFPATIKPEEKYDESGLGEPKPTGRWEFHGQFAPIKNTVWCPLFGSYYL